MSCKPSFAIVILAAGSSSRMGKIKQLLPWGNTSLLGNSISICKNSKATNVFVVLGANYNKIKLEVENKDVVLIKNDSWDKGMGTSIKSALNYFKERDLNFSAVLFTLADQPFITTKYYNLLFDSYKASEKGIIATELDEKIGVPAIFGSNYYRGLMKLDSDIGAKQIIKENIDDVKSIMSEVDFTDIDTFEVYEKLVKQTQKKMPN
ncbi:nucleotidyltransferase family protein [Lutibacter citreus]|uniref:nucleotidyltransferase family protein n=1 Tax=Lutibacter citreus TaxID=2138210 RepID=UPI000DBEA85A|nr:nucleotidyltransferase family protein [Lutibacter citreus]